MILTIARKELLGHLLSLRFGFAAVLCSVVVLFSCIGMCRQYQLRARDHSLVAARQGEARVSIPPTSTSVLAWGLEDITGRTVDLHQFPFVMTYPLESPLNIFANFFPTFDLSYVVRIVGSLIALAFAFDLICGEGRSGTLAQMMAAGASRPGVLLGKLVGGFPIVVLLFLGPLLVGAAVLTGLFAVPVSLDLLYRTVLWSGGTVLYLLCFFCLGLLCSAVLTSPRVSLMVCLVLWTVTVFVVPTAVTSILRVDMELQSPVRFEQLNYLSWIRWGGNREDRDGEIARQLQVRDARSREVLSFSGRTVGMLRLLPGTAYVDLSTSLSGTGLLELPGYYGAIQRYMRAVLDARKARVEIPMFTFQRAAIEACVQHATYGALSLVLWSTAAFWLSVVVFARTDVRAREVGQI